MTNRVGLNIRLHRFSSRVLAATRVAGLFLVYCCIAINAAAQSGSISTPIDQRAWIEFFDEATNTRYPRHDPNYIAGRDIFKGKAGHTRHLFCLAASEDAPRVTLNRENLKPYRKLPITEFVKTIYDCNAPDELLLNKLPKKDAGLVVYYLHKKYKLRLQQKVRKDVVVKAPVSEKMAPVKAPVKP